MSRPADQVTGDGGKTMPAVETLVVGAGQAGLPVARCLTGQGADHVVVERGRVAERWRSARWESLRLLTPNWMTALPGWYYKGRDPHGFMAADEFAGHLVDYAMASQAPVECDTPVLSVHYESGQFCIATPRQTWNARAVVI